MTQTPASGNTHELADVYAKRRQRLMEQMGPDSIALIPAAPAVFRNRDAEYRYRPDSSFYYLTGFAEPEALICLTMPPATAGDAGCFTLFCRVRNREREIWDGLRAGLEGAKTDFQADESFAIDTIEERIPALLLNKRKLYVRLGQCADFDQKVSVWLKKVAALQRAGGQAPSDIIQLDTLLDEMRLFKDDHELSLMRQAAEISARAHCRAMQQVQPGMMEYALEAELLYEFNKAGCQTAYGSIVGGGKNACILHYVDNNQPLQEGDLVLIDAGAELGCYAADITRTFPVNGRFSPEQAAVYQVVLDAQAAALAEVTPGALWTAPHEAAVKVLTEGLVRLGLLKGDVSQLIADERYKRFYMHRTGHWLGMDVHDVGNYRDPADPAAQRWRSLQPGMVLTVEPGLYIAADDDTVEERWRGIGIRIEDDVLVTENGHEILTSGVPSSIAQIEALMSKL